MAQLLLLSEETRFLSGLGPLTGAGEARSGPMGWPLTLTGGQAEELHHTGSAELCEVPQGPNFKQRQFHQVGGAAKKGLRHCRGQILGTSPIDLQR